MIKSLIPFFFQTNLSFVFPFVSLVVYVMSIFLLLDKTSFQPKPRSVSSSVIPGFNEVIVATLLIYIDTLSLSMSPFLRTLLCSLPPTLSVLMSYLYPFFIPSWLPHLYLWLLHLDYCRFIFVARVLTPSLQMTQSPMAPSSTTPVFLSPANLPIVVQKGTHSSCNLHPIYNVLTYHHLSSPYYAFISTLSFVSLS